jgi:hypothetical protein
VVNLFQSDFMASEEPADGHTVPVPADPTVRADEPGLEVARIRDRIELLREGSR